jgi:hypothetical protein
MSAADIRRAPAVPVDDKPESLRTLARQCRHVARSASTRSDADCLREMAEGYERRADRMARTEPAAEPRAFPQLNR